MQVLLLSKRLPAGHILHDIDPLLLETKPAAHCKHADLSAWPVAGEYVPGGQLMQLTRLVLEYVAAGQLVQLLIPGVADIRPEEHCRHTADDVAPVTYEYVPAGHRLHVAIPGVDEYVPVGQDWHELEPLLEYVPGPQATQAPSC